MNFLIDLVQYLNSTKCTELIIKIFENLKKIHL